MSDQILNSDSSGEGVQEIECQKEISKNPTKDGLLDSRRKLPFAQDKYEEDDVYNDYYEGGEFGSDYDDYYDYDDYDYGSQYYDN